MPGSIGRHRRQLRELRRSCRPVENERLAGWCLQTAQRLRLWRMPRVWQSKSTARPLLLGLFRPAVILPDALLANSSPAQVRMILAHELAHAKRLDLWWGWLHWWGETLFFFHPLIWLSRAEWRLTQELACDALAVMAAESVLADYGGMLLDIAAAPSDRPALSPGLTVGIIETKRTLERRIKAMKFIGQTTPKWIGLATAGLLSLGAMAALPWRVVGQAPATPERNQALPLSSPGPKQNDAAAQTPSVRAADESDRQPGTARNTEMGEAQAEMRRAQAVEKRGAAMPDPADKSQGRLRVFPLKYADAEEVASQVQKLHLDPAKKVVVVADIRTNAVLVHAPEDEMRTIVELIHTLDVPAAESRRVKERGLDLNESDRPIAIISSMPGYVQSVFVTSGKAVKKGDPLIQLDDQDARGKLNNAIAQIDVAKAALAIQEAEAKGVRREWERTKDLAEKKVISSDDVEAKATAYEVAQARIAKAQAELRLAEQQVDQAKSELTRLTLRAPRDGTVSKVRVQAGEYVSGPAGQPLLLIHRQADGF